MKITLKYKLDLKRINVQKLVLELNYYFVDNREEFKYLLKTLGSKKHLYKEDSLYHIFIGFYMNPFDTKMCEIIGNFGLYTRNDEEIIINLYLDTNPQYLNANNCGVFSDKIETEIVLNGIKHCLGWLSTKYISYKIV